MTWPCENASEPMALRIVFSIALCQQQLPVRLVSAANSGHAYPPDFRIAQNADTAPRGRPLSKAMWQVGRSALGCVKTQTPNLRVEFPDRGQLLAGNGHAAAAGACPLSAGGNRTSGF